MRKRVVVIDHGFKSVHQEAAAAASMGAGFEVFQCRSSDDVAAAAAGADVAVVQFAPFSRAAVQALNPGGRVIRYGVGFDNIDVGAARDAKIAVAYVPDYCTNEVADHTAASVLALLRAIPKLDQGVRNGTWSVLQTAPEIKTSDKLVLGFLGLGRIGRGTLARLKPFGYSMLTHDPALDVDEANALGTHLCEREALLAQADMLVLHLPLTSATKHIVNENTLARMKPGSYLVNTARGGLVDERALAEALTTGHLAGAALDVFEKEPLPNESILRAAPNLILSPHAGWYSSGALEKLQSLVADEIVRALSGASPRCPVQ